MKDTPQLSRLLLSILAVTVGLFMIAVAPFLIQTPLERVLSALQIVSAEKPAYASGILLFSYAFPLYRGLIFIGGIALPTENNRRMQNVLAKERTTVRRVSRTSSSR